MKAAVYSIKGKKKGEIEMPVLFSQKVRKDIAAKYFEADKFTSPYSPDELAGNKYSASGKIRHRRHRWGSHYGRGISRIPRKTMWRRGTQFFWIGATAPGTKGGRRAHPPKGIGKEKKINQKEIKVAMSSGFAATSDKDFVIGRYGRLDKLSLNLPIVLESKLDHVKTKEVKETLKNILGEVYKLILINKEVRAGKGKLRGRKYKSNAGLLFVKGKEEKIKINGVDVKNVEEISIADLYPLGRLAVYTEKALEELGGKK